MIKIENGYKECYYLTEDGMVYNSDTNKYREADKEKRFSLQTIDGKCKKISLKVLYRMVYGKNYCNDEIGDLRGEKWIEIENTDGMYYVSNKGRIKSLKGYNAIVLKANKTKSGYCRLEIVQNGERVAKFVHRLVAVAFLPIPDSIDMELHHKDCNKENNASDNLEWLTMAEHKKKHKERGKSNAKL